MRTLFLLRGSPASGKSTWIETNKLENYTLSADKIRLLIQSPTLNNDGKYVITQKNDNKVWNLLFNILEEKMSRGEFCIIDATHYKAELLRKYKDLISKYRYRAYVIDFTDVSLDELLKRNKERDEFKYVPEDVIKKMVAVFSSEQDNKQVSNMFTILKPNEAIDFLNKSLTYDYNNYEKIVVFGDIHGCYEPIKTYFEKNPFSTDNAYIFVGDYIDRGLQNKEVLDFLYSIKDNKNVLLLEGNHEQQLRIYSDKEREKKFNETDVFNIKDYQNCMYIPTSTKFVSDVLKRIVKNALHGRFYSYSNIARGVLNKQIKELKEDKKSINTSGLSKEFANNTIHQLKSMDKSHIRRLCDKLAQFAYFNYNDKVYFISHGGISTLPTIFTSTEEFIRGTGKYEDTEHIYNSWLKSTPENHIMIHGHRNVFDLPTKINDRIYNLNSDIEYGSDLRILEITKNGVNELSVSNPVFKQRNKIVDVVYSTSSVDILNQLNQSKIVNKKLLEDNIVSYNFNRDVFAKKIWTDLTCKARGLFVNKKTSNIVCRSYDKFFNINEMQETKLETLKKSLTFPVYGYLKENGFLGLVSWDKDNNKLFIASKSTNVGDFADMVREQFNKLSKKDEIIEFLKTNNVSMIFEVIDIVKDPHIIKYNESKIVLLDIVENSFNPIYYTFEELTKFATQYNIECKKLELQFDNYDDFYEFINNCENDDDFTNKTEGWVFVDNKGFMVKYKTKYYKFWKWMRSFKQHIEKNRVIKQTFNSEKEVKIVQLMKKIPAEKLQEMSIIDIQDKFYK